MSWHRSNHDAPFNLGAKFIRQKEKQYYGGTFKTQHKYNLESVPVDCSLLSYLPQVITWPVKHPYQKYTGSEEWHVHRQTTVCLICFQFMNRLDY